MKVLINKIQSKIDENVIFNIHKITPYLDSIINHLKKDPGSSYLLVNNVSTNKSTKLLYFDIYYLEYLERNIYIYTESDVYTIKEPLYKLEKQLPDCFIRCSKSMIINIGQIKEFNSTLSGNLTAKLSNNEEVIISRRYIKSVKENIESII
ncbi:LytTR family DNA-binding domain-containing protein (plasmid) [Paraclostridium bifermentans]|uniref:LytTR family DNA-binding domain-containing protein n=1 Tax=Paraclostridium bifermentans TaxID=1490 RepID=A0ABY8R877_PARBF|nr:LytTR family DNA-binding domain-containing protein [Paraclostridium bifermentans]